jgi:hypothetical protein
MLTSQPLPKHYQPLSPQAHQVEAGPAAAQSSPREAAHQWTPPVSWLQARFRPSWSVDAAHHLAEMEASYINHSRYLAGLALPDIVGVVLDGAVAGEEA